MATQDIDKIIIRRVAAVVSSPRKSVLKNDIVEAEKKGKSVPFKKTFFG